MCIMLGSAWNILPEAQRLCTQEVEERLNAELERLSIHTRCLCAGKG